MTFKLGFAAMTFLALTPAIHGAIPQNPSSTPPPKPSVRALPLTHDQYDNGDEIWAQQCSRCHSAPQGFSPRIAGTVIRHMRVRASLSKHEEQELLHFLNP